MLDSEEDYNDRKQDYLDYADDEEYDERDYEHDAETRQLDAAYQKYLRGSDSDAGPKRRMARGLLSQTIHEEDDSSGD